MDYLAILIWFIFIGLIKVFFYGISVSSIWANVTHWRVCSNLKPFSINVLLPFFFWTITAEIISEADCDTTVGADTTADMSAIDADTTGGEEKKKKKKKKKDEEEA